MATADLSKPGGPVMETIRQGSLGDSFSIMRERYPFRPTKFGTSQGIPPTFLNAFVRAASNKFNTNLGLT